jgi:putative two-component system response regulator
MAIVDAYDALISERPYCRRLTQEEALTVLRRERGKQFDPALASIFIDLVESGRLSNTSP